ncbi:hypothetical protein [Cyclobacterium xiamenense]|nr:hypothetical protein [Cyclobacterium xiamenense]
MRGEAAQAVRADFLQQRVWVPGIIATLYPTLAGNHPYEQNTGIR